jgi:hypothetical protein
VPCDLKTPKRREVGVKAAAAWVPLPSVFQETSAVRLASLTELHENLPELESWSAEPPDAAAIFSIGSTVY